MGSIALPPKPQINPGLAYLQLPQG